MTPNSTTAKGKPLFQRKPMFQALTLFVLVICIATWRQGGPLRALTIAWLVCLGPVALDIVSYGFLDWASDRYIWLIGASIVAFAAGTLLIRSTVRAPAAGSISTYDWDRDFANWLPFAKVCLIVASVANVAMLIKFFSVDISGDNLDDIRSQVVGLQDGAGIIERVAAVTVWACFACLAFGLYFRHKMSRLEFALYMAMSLGVFLTSLVSAGRQAVAQVILLSLLLEAVRSSRIANSERSIGNWGARTVLVGLATSVILFVTINRSSLSFGRTKADLFLIYFDARFSDWFESLIGPLGQGVRDFVTEFILYISNSVPLFSRLETIDFGQLFYGVFDFPFVMRQIEPLTGLSVIDTWEIRTRYLSTENVIGTGWTTTPSHLLMDFGAVGMVAFLFFQGMFSEWTWSKVRHGGGFGITLTCVVMTIAAIYMPFLPALSDTNLFLLLVVLGGVMVAKRSRASAVARNNAARNSVA